MGYYGPVETVDIILECRVLICFWIKHVLGSFNTASGESLIVPLVGVNFAANHKGTCYCALPRGVRRIFGGGVPRGGGGGCRDPPKKLTIQFC